MNIWLFTQLHTIQLFAEQIMKLRHVSHDAELVREVVKENILDLYERRHPQAVLGSYKRELQVPSIHNINISMKR